MGESGNEFVLWSDNKYVVDMYARITGSEGRWLKSGLRAHGDRWAKVWSMVKEREIRPAVMWVKAHVTKELQKKLAIDPRVLAGNECADAMAARGAGLGDLDINQKRKIRLADRKAWVIRNRLAHIQVHILETQGDECDGAGEDQRKAKKASRDRCRKRKVEEREAEQEDGGNEAEAPKPEEAATGDENQAKKQKFDIKNALHAWFLKRSLEQVTGVGLQLKDDRPAKRRIRTKTSEAALRAEEANRTTEAKKSLAQEWQESVDGRVKEIRDQAHLSHRIKGNEHLLWCEVCGNMTKLDGDDHQRRKLLKKCARPAPMGKRHLKAISCGKNPLDAKR